MAESGNDDNPLEGSITSEVAMNSSVDDVYDIFRNKCNLFKRLMPEKIQNVELIKPDWNSVGSIRRWTFVDVGKCGIWKDVVEANDDMSVTWTLVDGEVPKKLYRSLKVIFKFYLQCGTKAPMALVTVNYEKNDATVPVPEEYLDFACDMVKAAANIPLEQ